MPRYFLIEQEMVTVNVEKQDGNFASAHVFLLHLTTVRMSRGIFLHIHAFTVSKTCNVQ